MCYMILIVNRYNKARNSNGIASAKFLLIMELLIPIRKHNSEGKKKITHISVIS